MASTDHLRKFSTTFFQNKTATDNTQIPSAQTVYVYRQGATVTVGGTVTNTAGGVSITVNSVGHLRVNDTVYKNGNSGISMNVESITSDTIIKLRSSGSNVILSQNDRLITTNEVPTLYFDSGATLTVNNPYTADDQGLVEFYTPETMFDMVVGTTIYPNNVSGWIRGGGQFVNVKDYSTIQAAVNALPDGTRGTVFFPAGTYTVTASITANNTNTHFLGEKGFTTLSCSNPAIDIIHIEYFGCTVENFGFIGPNSSGAGIGINFKGVSQNMAHSTVKNCTFDNMASWAISVTTAGGGKSAYFTRIEDCVFNTCKSGGNVQIGDPAVSSDLVTSCFFSRCHFHAPGSQSTFASTLQKGVVHLFNAQSTSFHRCYWELTDSTSCLSFEGLSGCNMVVLDGCVFEITSGGGDNGHFMLQNGCNMNNLIVMNCSISRASATYGVKFFTNKAGANNRGTVFTNNFFSITFNGATPNNDIVLANALDELVITNNRQQNSTAGTYRKLVISFVDSTGIGVYGQWPESRFKITAVSGTGAVAAPMMGDMCFVSGASPGLYYYTTAWVGPVT